MSRYAEFDTNGVQTTSILERKSLVNADRHFTRAARKGETVQEFIAAIPGKFGHDLRSLADRIVRAKLEGKAVVWACGAHVIKCGLSPVLIGLMEVGYVSALAIHGAGAIHDVEIGRHGYTSEDVAEALPAGTFGTARETATFFNCTITRAKQERMGAGEALGKAVWKGGWNSDKSLLATGWKRHIPVTVHTAVGTDIVHMHNSADGAAIGETSLRDFRILTAVMRNLSGGGVLLNVGSAVILPEVLLKAMALLRNENADWGRFLGVDFDFLRSYRSQTQIVERVQLLGGEGMALTGHHELLLPLLAHAILCREEIG